MRLEIHETEPGEFDQDPEHLHAVAHDALRKAIGHVSPGAADHARGGEVDLPQDVADHIQATFQARMGKLWQDVASKLLDAQEDKP
jgi:hypothetical protein